MDFQRAGVIGTGLESPERGKLRKGLHKKRQDTAPAVSTRRRRLQLQTGCRISKDSAETFRWITTVKALQTLQATAGQNELV